MNHKRFSRTLLEVEEDGGAGRPVTGWVKDGRRYLLMRSLEGEKRRAGTTPRLIPNNTFAAGN